jgi:hypothetical protein
MKLILRKVNKDKNLIYSDEEIDTTGLVELRISVGSNEFQISQDWDSLNVRSSMGRLIVRPRSANTILVRLE